MSVMSLWLLPFAFATTPGPSAGKLIRCALYPDSYGCAFVPPPRRFDVLFDCGLFGTFAVCVTTAWQPVYATRLWQLVNLDYFLDDPMYRFDYRNESTRFVVQYGASLLPGVQAAWDSHRAISEATAARVSNTRGRLTFSLDAAVCNASATPDPCAPYRPACTADDYCAYGGSTQLFINLENNSRLDAHGFAPIGEVLGDGLEVIEAIGAVVGNEYGEVTDLCPVDEAGASVFCIYRDGRRQGVDPARILLPSAREYIQDGFPLMWERRVLTAKLVGWLA